MEVADSFKKGPQSSKRPERVVVRVPFHTVDGRNPAPPGMYKTPVNGISYCAYQLVQDFFHQQYIKASYTFSDLNFLNAKMEHRIPLLLFCLHSLRIKA